MVFYSVSPESTNSYTKKTCTPNPLQQRNKYITIYKIDEKRYMFIIKWEWRVWAMITKKPETDEKKN